MNQKQNQNNTVRKLTFISASAGTGKTTTIVKYFFENLAVELEKTNSEITAQQLAEILNKFVAITFTNAAANELKKKIIAGLRNPSPDTLKGVKDDTIKKISEKLKDNLIDKVLIIKPLRISTIHRFALEIVRLFHSELYLPVDIEFTEEEDVWEDAMKLYFNFEDFSNNENVKNFIAYYKVTDLKRLISTVGRKYYFYINSLGNIKAPPKIEEIKFDDLQLIKEFETYDWSKEYDQHYMKKRQEYLKKVGRRKLPRGAGNEIKREIEKELAKEISRKLQGISNIITNIQNYLLDLITKIGEWYEEVIRFKGVIDYDGLLFILAKFLKGKKTDDLLNELKQKGAEIKYIFVDEAQDNSFLQYFIIDKLVCYKEPKICCYIVGDLKQSIYHWREAFPVLFETLKNFCKQAQQGDALRRDLAYETLKVTYRIKNQALLDLINSYCRGWSQNGWKHYNSNEDSLEFPESNPQNCPQPENNNPNNTQPEKTYAILGRSRNTCKKLLEQVGKRDKLPLNNIRNRAGFDIREEKEILWFYTLLDFINNPEDETNFFTLSMLFLPGIREKFGIIKPQDNQQDNTFVKILNINLEDAKSELKNEFKNIVDNIPYINVDKKFTTEISKFMLSYTTKNKIFDKQEFRNILHFLANIYFLEKKFTNPTLKFYYRRLKEIYEGTATGITNNQIFDTPDVWGPPKPRSLEISTIHSAKGLEYDIVYVDKEEIETLTKDDIEGNKLDRYVYVFELESESNDPENFKLYWLPVNILKLIRPKEIRAIIRRLSDKSLIVDGIKRYIYSTVQENFNLAYVLITRAREELK